MIIFCSPDECGKMIQSHLPPAFAPLPSLKRLKYWLIKRLAFMRL